MLLTLGLIYHSFSLDFWTWLELLGVFQDTKNTVTMVFAGPPAGLPEIVCNNCSYVNYPIRLTPQCSPVFLLILVVSRTANRKQRDLIRTTWAQQSKSQEVGTIFILGRNHIAADSVILHESEKYHDIVQFDFLDTYKNLTIKTVSALKWAKYNCPSVRYILKTDDDTFNNIPGILKFIHSAHLTNSMSGRCFTHALQRKNSSRYYIPQSVYPYTYLPVYCSGSGYIIPRHVLDELVDKSNNIKLFPSEDTYITGLVRHFVRASYHQMPKCAIPFKQFVNMSDYERQGVLNIHGIPLGEMKTLWKYYSAHEDT